MPSGGKTSYQSELDDKKLESANLVEISSSVTLATEDSVIRSSFDFLSSIFASLMKCTPFHGLDSAKIQSIPSTCFSMLDCAAAGILLGNIIKGLFYATSQSHLKTEATTLIKGLALRMILIVHRNSDCIVRVDAGGRVFTGKITNDVPIALSLKNMQNRDIAHSPIELTTASAKLGPMEPLGSFKFIGRLQNAIDPFVLCKSLVAVLCEENSDWHAAALQIMDDIVEMLHQLCKQTSLGENTFFSDSGVGAVVLENLLLYLSQSCFSQPWNLRIGPYSAILRLCHSMHSGWASKYQDLLMHTALFSVKDSPREIPSASRYSLTFCIKVFTLLYGAPLGSGDTSGVIISDALTVCSSYELESHLNHDSKLPAPAEASRMDIPSGDIAQGKTSTAISQSVLSMLVAEINSTKNILRFASRHCLMQYALVNGCCMEDLLVKSVSFFRKALFSRSLRTLPLKEQVAATQALAFIIDSAPSLFPLKDTEIYPLLSELLKMTAIADGVMTAKEGENFPLVDKDGFVSSPHTSETKNQTSKHGASMFFADSYTLLPSETGGMQVNIPPDLPDGVQLRVSALLLFRAVIRRHTDLFFDAPSSDAVGNMRPHVISLFFRSLVSGPVQVVAASHLALKDVLALGMNTATSDLDNQQTKSLSHRLSKELLQTCIRPVLLNLRDQ
jgi:transformation/transcription domain-associated protein